MQLFVVHQDADVAEQLAQMVRDYTAHDCDWARSDAAAIDWAKTHDNCAVLIAQLDGSRTNALNLGPELSAIFPGLQILFLPSYPRSEQRFEVANTKVFPEPIEGELLLGAIERAAIVPFGAPDLFHVLDVLQMCCLSRRSGAVQLVRGETSAIVFLRDGHIVHAETPTAHGRSALEEIAGWSEVEFAYDDSVRVAETITGRWDETLVDAVARQRNKPAAPPVEATQKIVFEELPPAEQSSSPTPIRRLFAGLRRR